MTFYNLTSLYTLTYASLKKQFDLRKSCFFEHQKEVSQKRQSLSKKAKFLPFLIFFLYVASLRVIIISKLIPIVERPRIRIYFTTCLSIVGTLFLALLCGSIFFTGDDILTQENILHIIPLCQLF